MKTYILDRLNKSVFSRETNREKHEEKKENDKRDE